MNKAIWKIRYINFLIRKGGFTKKEALENYNAGKDNFDFDDSPEDAADDELYYYKTDR